MFLAGHIDSVGTVRLGDERIEDVRYEIVVEEDEAGRTEVWGTIQAPTENLRRIARQPDLPVLELGPEVGEVRFKVVRVETMLGASVAEIAVVSPVPGLQAKKR